MIDQEVIDRIQAAAADGRLLHALAAVRPNMPIAILNQAAEKLTFGEMANLAEALIAADSWLQLVSVPGEGVKDG